MEPTSPPPSGTPPKRRGLIRLWYAMQFSWDGLRVGWHEPAFRQELLLAAVLLPSAWLIGQSWIEVMALIGVVILVLVVELLNTAIESVVDRVGPQWHTLSKRAKDTGSAAVLLSLLLCLIVWLTAIIRWMLT